MADDVPPGARFQLMAGPAGRTPVRELTQASGVTCTWRLTPSHELSFSIPGRPSTDELAEAVERGSDPALVVPQAASVRELRDDVHLLLDGKALYTGRVGQPTDNPTDVDHTRAVATADYRAIFGRRFWRGAQTTWTQEQTAVLAQLVQAGQADTGGNLGVAVTGLPTTGQNASRVTEPGARILDEVQALATAGTENTAGSAGFDWDITPGWTGRTLQVWYPGRGRAVNPLVYRWQANRLAKETSVLRNLTRTSNPGDYANAVLVTGGTKTVTTTSTVVDPVTGETVIKTERTEVPTTPVYLAVPDIASRPEGLWMQVLSYPDITEQAELQAKAQERLNALATLSATWSFDLDLGTWLDAGGPDGLWLGDTVPVIVTSGVVNDDLVLRVTELRLTLDGNGGGTITVTLGAPRTPTAGFIAALGQRLAVLELRS